MSPEVLAESLRVDLEYVNDLMIVDIIREGNVVILTVENGERFSLTAEEL